MVKIFPANPAPPLYLSNGTGMRVDHNQMCVLSHGFINSCVLQFVYTVAILSPPHRFYKNVNPAPSLGPPPPLTCQVC